jgi:hypothetical protein
MLLLVIPEQKDKMQGTKIKIKSRHLSQMHAIQTYTYQVSALATSVTGTRGSSTAQYRNN